MSSSSRLSLADLCQPTFSPVQNPSTSSMIDRSNSSTPVHAGTKRPLTIDDQDEDVRIAVRALGDMRSKAVAAAHTPSTDVFPTFSQTHSGGTSSTSLSTSFVPTSPAPTTSSTSASSPMFSRDLELPPEADKDEEPYPSSSDFVSRVSNLPIVNTALKAYEHTKKRSRVVNYGAQFMETSVKTISRPVFNRLPVSQIDEFACRQLDKLGCANRSEGASQTTPVIPTIGELPTVSPQDDIAKSFYKYREPVIPDSLTSSRAPSLTPENADEQSAYDSPKSPPQNLPSISSTKTSSHDSSERAVERKSAWQAVLSEAGGISAAVSVEGVKRLKFCLHWLQYATARIDSQIVLLKRFIDSLNPQSSGRNDPNVLVSLQAMRTLNDVRKDVINTIRQVVDIISKYAGGVLPEPARSTVRTFILRLPARWAANAGISERRNGHTSAPSSPSLNSVPLGSEEGGSSSNVNNMRGRPTAGRATHPTAIAATQAAQRILTLATESCDMMRSVTTVFKDSLEKAEAWVERLRIVGIQRQGSMDPSTLGDLPPSLESGSSTNNNPPTDISPSLSPKVGLRKRIGVGHGNSDAEEESNSRRVSNKPSSEGTTPDDRKTNDKRMDVDS